MAFSNKKWKNSQTGAKVTNCFLVELSGTVTVPESLLLMMVGLLLCVHYESAEGIFIEKSKNAIVIVNDSTFFNCSKSSNKSTEPAWYHHPLVGAREDVYDYGKIIDKYKDRFNIDKNTTSDAFNLLVLRPQSTDAGRYECVEEDGEEDKGPSAELTVLHSNLVCESDKDLNEIIGPTECSNPIAPDQFQLLCNATYSGNISPRMQWRRVGSQLLSNKTKCDVHDNRVMCNAALEANLNMDGSVYICQIITAQQYNCSLKINKTIYAFANTTQTDYPIGEEVTCVANVSNQLPCTYKWFDDNTTEVSSNETFKPNDPGLYRCQAQCAIRDESCKFTAMVINVSTVPDSGPNLLHCLWLLLLLIPGVTLAILYKDIWLGWLRRCRTKNESVTPSPYEIEVLEEVKVNETNQLATPLMDRPAVGPEDLGAQQPESHNKLEEIVPLVAPAQPAQPAQPANPASCQDAPKVREQLVEPKESNGTDEDDSDYDFENACNVRHFKDKGLNGDIFGPVPYKGIECIIERIMISLDQQTLANAEEMIEKEHISSNDRLWKAWDHGNLLKFYGVFQRSRAVYIVMEYATGGSVREALSTCKEDLQMSEVIDWATQIAKGLNYLHEKDIVHRNITSAQIFIVEEINEPSDISIKKLKIGCISLLDNESTNGGTSTLRIMHSFSSPEALTQGVYSKQSDVWSFGTVIWEILTRKRPYENIKGLDNIRRDLLNGAESLEIPKSCPEELRQILIECRIVEPSGRPTFIRILQNLDKCQ